MKKVILLLGLIIVLTSCNQNSKDNTSDESELPITDETFKGKIGKTYETSEEYYAEPVKPPAGAPNVVIILLDDVGFGHTSTFGGPANTPNIQSLAEEGLTYTRFHTTGICSPTRSALLTGRNHHQVGFGTISELASGYPGYNTEWGRENASIAEILRQHGYSTAAWGKWHNTPDWQTSSSGPFDNWPTNLGFEYWYGFQGGETSQWEPQLYLNTHPVPQPKSAAQGYHLTQDLTENSIAWLRQQRSLTPDKPYFMYMAPGAAHAPLHVPKEYIAKYKGKFDNGWDAMREHTFKRQKEMGIIPQNTKLTPRPKEIPAWDAQSADAKKVYARQMEVYAAFLDHTDHYMGEFIKEVRKLPGGDNTVIMYIVGDNGGSPEGTLTGTLNNMMTQNGLPDTIERQLAHLDETGGVNFENHYAVAWAWAGSTPFQWMKRVPSHFGGTRNGMVISWPKGIKNKGEKRTQFSHVNDVAPTIYDIIGIPFPNKVNGVKQHPIAGFSMKESFASAKSPEFHHTQYFETGGHRAIYHDGWIAATFHGAPWLLTGSVGFKNDKWELYNIKEDFSESNDLAAKNPEKLKELIALFDKEADKYQVWPLDDRFVERAKDPKRPGITKGKKSFTYLPGTERIPEGSAPNTYSASHSVTAKFTYKKGDEGVLIANGGRSAGWSMYVDKGGKLHYYYNFFHVNHYDFTVNLPTGVVEVKMDYKHTGKKAGEGGIVDLYVNGKKISSTPLPHRVPVRHSATETMDIGKDCGGPVNPEYANKLPYAYSGNIEYVKIDVK